MRRTVFVALSAALLFLCCGSLTAGSYGGPKMPGMPGGGPHSVGMPSILIFAGELDLTPQQTAKLRELEKASAAGTELLMKEMEKLMDEMRTEIEKPEPDETKLQSVIERLGENHKALLKLKVHDMLKINAVLTAEQRKKMKVMMGAGGVREMPPPGAGTGRAKPPPPDR